MQYKDIVSYVKTSTLAQDICSEGNINPAALAFLLTEYEDNMTIEDVIEICEHMKNSTH